MANLPDTEVVDKLGVLLVKLSMWNSILCLSMCVGTDPQNLGTNSDLQVFFFSRLEISQKILV